MPAQRNRDAAVVIALPGACRRHKIVQWARSAVNQEDTCGAKKAGRDCGLKKCTCEPLLGRVLRYCKQTIMQSAAAQLISDSGAHLANYYMQAVAQKEQRASHQNKAGRMQSADNRMRLG